MKTRGHSKTINAQIEDETLARIAQAVRAERERHVDRDGSHVYCVLCAEALRREPLTKAEE